MGAEERTEGVQEGEEVGGGAGVGWVDGWRKECGDYEAVDCGWWRGIEGLC